jgi:hypothetical protein
MLRGRLGRTFGSGAVATPLHFEREQPMTVLESFFTHARMQTETVSRRLERVAQSQGLAPGGRAGEIYDEQTFRHFLTVERVRAELSKRPFLVLLLGLRRCPTNGVSIPGEHSTRFLSALGECVREVDFVGWYQEGRVLGAVLPQDLDVIPAEARSAIVSRVKMAVTRQLPGEVADRLRVRVVELGRVART